VWAAAVNWVRVALINSICLRLDCSQAVWLIKQTQNCLITKANFAEKAGFCPNNQKTAVFFVHFARCAVIAQLSAANKRIAKNVRLSLITCLTRFIVCLAKTSWPETFLN
jgi:hypothetical protein